MVPGLEATKMNSPFLVFDVPEGEGQRGIRQRAWMTALGMALVSVCVAWSSSVFSADAVEPAALEDVGQAINVAWREHIEAARRKDLDAVTRIYADDVTYVIPGVQEARGRAAINELEAQALASANVLEAVHTTESLRVFGDLAYELGTVVGPVQPEGKPAQTVTFHFMATWRRQTDGTWRIEFMVGEAEQSGVDKPPE